MTPASVSPRMVPPVSPAVVRRDFPGWLPATLVKELRQGLRTKGFVGAFIGFQVLMAVVMMGISAQSMMGNSSGRAMRFSAADGFFWAILVLQLIVFAPSRALGSLQLEISSRTIDLLMLTRLNAWRIVTGKWASLVAQSALLLIAMLPYGIIRYFTGSVDLVNDAGRCIALLGASALLTAAGLWGAGMGKIFRIVGIVAAVVMMMNGGTFLRGMGTPGTPFAMFAGLRGASVGLLWFNGLLFLLFFLVAAVRNIAPRAENHTLLVRLLPVLAMLPVPLTSMLSGPTPAMAGQLMVSGVFLLVVCMCELASIEWPLMVHFRAARKWSSLPRVFLRMTLPGWPSAFLYAIFATTLWLGCTATMGSRSGTAPTIDTARSVWIAVLGLAALVFPSLILSFLPRAPKSAGGIYIVTFVAAGALAPIAYAFAEMSPKLAFAKSIAGVLPVSSFVLSLANESVGVPQVAVQAVFAITVIALAVWQTRYYWQHLMMLEGRERRAAR